MIGVKKDYGQAPEQLSRAGAERQREAALREGNQHQANGAYYAHESVKQALIEIYRNKCAYCESPKSPGWAWRVDHYRPVKARTRGDTHTGYHWLAYEWSNLLLSCETCNINKSNQFPIESTRVETPQTNRADWRADSESFIAEKPLLLNPELDRPEAHLVFSPNGGIAPKADSQRGKTTIEVCNLDRQDLQIARKNVADRLVNSIEAQAFILLNMRENGELETRETFLERLRLGFDSLFKRLMNTQNPQQQYSRLGWHLANDFQTFIINNLPAGEPREIVGFAFELFRAEWGMMSYHQITEYR